VATLPSVKQYAVGAGMATAAELEAGYGQIPLSVLPLFLQCALARPLGAQRLGPDHGRDAAVQMIDTSVVRVHQHAACIADNNQQDMGRSRGGLTSKISRWWTPMVCRSISLSRQVKRTTTGCVRFS